MGEIFGKDYILDTTELRTWSRILEEPIRYRNAEEEPSGRPPTKGSFGSEPRSLVITPDELPEGHELLRENFTSAPQPDLPCAHQISVLVASVRDLVKTVTHPSATTSVIPEDSEAGGKMRCRKKRDSSTSASSSRIAPRFVRLRDAPAYLGMDPNRFNEEVRPYLTEMRIGKQGVAFDKIDLDTWAEQYKDRNGRPGKAMKGGESWGRKSHQGSSKEAKSGTFRRQSQVKEFEKALQRATSRKRRDT